LLLSSLALPALAAPANAKLSVAISDGLPAVHPGDAVTYTITARNRGPADVTGATVADTFPATLTGVTWTCVSGTGSTCGSAAGAGNFSFLVNLVKNAAVTITVHATVDPAAVGTVADTVTITAPAGITDPQPADNTATDADVVILPNPNNTFGSAKDILLGNESTDYLGPNPDDNNWFTFKVAVARSYCVEVDNGLGEVTRRDPVITVYASDHVSPVATNDTLVAEPAAFQLARACFVADGSQVNYAKVTPTAGNQVGTFRIRVVETTLYSPWFFSGNGYDSFILLRNTTAQAINATVVLVGPTGNPVGGAQTSSLPPNGSYNLLLSGPPPNGFGLEGVVNGGVYISHTGAPGAIIGNVTSLNFNNGVSFDTPAAPRQDLR